MRNLFLLPFFLCLFSVCAQEKFDAATVIAHREKQHAEFLDAKKSPLTDADRTAFKGLDYFEPSAKYFVLASFRRTGNEKAFEMKTTSTRRPLYRKYGELRFMLDGKPYKLNVYQNLELMTKPGFSDYLFLPFSDLTSGNETYIGGRYIDMKIPTGDSVAIDFNLAYNPYCAYNPKFSCPIVPLENDLQVEIRAGVKKFHD